MGKASPAALEARAPYTDSNTTGQRLVASLLAAFVVACTGTIENGVSGAGGGKAVQPGRPSSDAGPGAGAGPPPGPGERPQDPKAAPLPTVDDVGKPLVEESSGRLPLRRLTRREFDNTLGDLLGDHSAPARAFPIEMVGDSGFDTPTPVAPLDVRLYLEAAEAVAARITPTIATLVPCDATTRGEEGCADQLVRVFGSRAFRRPVAPEEAADLLGIYKIARETLAMSHPESLAAVLQAMLQSPGFLYHWEEDGADAQPSTGGLLKLSPYHTASRLSYALWGTMPDEELFAAAAAGKLADAGAVALQAQRMLAKRAVAAGGVRDFFFQIMHLDGIRDLQKNPRVYQDFDARMRTGMTEEFGAFVSDVVLEKDGRLATLLTSPVSFVNEAIAPVYGLSGVTGEALKEVTLDPGQRAGLLTQTAFLAVNADTGGSHPIKRGDVIWKRFVCGPALSAPANVPEAEPADPAVSTRKRFAKHAESACATCHKLIDPLGFAFEHYDGLGQYRTMDGGEPVDASGIATLPSGQTLAFANAVELVQGLAVSDDVRRCVARQWFRYVLGRKETVADEGSFERAYAAFAASDFNLRALLTAVVQTKSFLYRTPNEEMTP